jgi:hypothetical protein
MSPLKIIALLNLYCTTKPFQGCRPEYARSSAMTQAYEDFAQQGLLADGVTLDTAIQGLMAFPALTEKGAKLVSRLRGVEP